MFNKEIKKTINKLEERIKKLEAETRLNTSNINRLYNEKIGEVYCRTDILFCPASNSNKQWFSIRKNDIIERRPTEIKIQKYDEKPVWIPINQFIFYNDVYNSQRKKIEKERK